MLLLNFSHYLTPNNVAEVQAMAESGPIAVRDTPVHFDVSQPFARQVVQLVDGLGLTPAEWQIMPILINPPALTAISVVLLAELHGRMGYFPSVIRLRPVEGAAVLRFEVAEIINLQSVRDRARGHRAS